MTRKISKHDEQDHKMVVMMLMIVLLPLMMPAVSRPSVSGEFGGKLRWMELRLEQLHFQEIPNTKTQLPIHTKYQ